MWFNILIMRTILFRGKPVGGGDFVYGSLIQKMYTNFIGSYEITGATWNDPLGDSVWVEIEVDSKTIGQLLTDIVNPNFYEGDIIADTLNLSNDTDMETAYAVTWENFKDISPTGFLIGNIHDNPELLK